MKMKRFDPFALVLASLVIVAGLLFSSAWSSAPKAVSAQVPQPTPTVPLAIGGRTVSVTGSGTVEAVPDKAVVMLGVRTQAVTARDALTQNNTQMQALVNSLSTNGIDKKDIKTQIVQIQPDYQNSPVQPNQVQGSPKLVGYIALNTVSVTVRDLTKLGQLLDTAATAGSNEISSIQFDLSDPTQAQDQARQAAMQDAARKAGQLATLGNATLGTVISIDENSLGPVPYMGATAGAAMAADASVPVSAGTQTVQVTVRVIWELNTK